MTHIEEKVRRWSRPAQELWFEMAGKLLSDGVSQDLADQRAYIETLRYLREQTTTPKAEAI